MIDLHFWPTPNGLKVTILLEECGLPYRIVPCNILQGDQFSDEFLKICPNHRIPAIVDPKPADGGEPLALFESGAIMIYRSTLNSLAAPEGLERPVAVAEGRLAGAQFAILASGPAGRPLSEAPNLPFATRDRPLRVRSRNRSLLFSRRARAGPPVSRPRGLDPWCQSRHHPARTSKETAVHLS